MEFMLAKRKAGVPLGAIAADLGRTETAVNGKLQKLREEGMKIAEELAAEEAKAAKEQGAIKQKEPSKAMDKEKNISIAEMLLAGYTSLTSLSGLEDEIIIEIKKGQVQMHAACDGCVVTITFEGEEK